MTVSQDLSFISLISNASLLVQLIMLLLLVVSLMSWTFIFQKMFAIKNARAETGNFEQAFWSGGNLQSLYQRAGSSNRTGALERIFYAGMGEYIKGKSAMTGHSAQDTVAVLDGARRAMRAAYQREMDNLESHLAFLASVGSVSPYVGLFGTVWGIMNAFRGLANVHQATLATVAPGDCRSADRHGNRLVRRDSGSGCL